MRCRQLLAGASSEHGPPARAGCGAELTKRLVKPAMEVDLTEHVGYDPHAEPPGGSENTRNWTSPKLLIAKHGEVGSTRQGSQRSGSGCRQPSALVSR
jgi:putative transposase